MTLNNDNLFFVPIIIFQEISQTIVAIFVIFNNCYWLYHKSIFIFKERK